MIRYVGTLSGYSILLDHTDFESRRGVTAAMGVCKVEGWLVEQKSLYAIEHPFARNVSENVYFGALFEGGSYQIGLVLTLFESSATDACF